MFKLNEEQKAKIKDYLEKGEEFCEEHSTLVTLGILATMGLGFNISYKKVLNKTSRKYVDCLVAELSKSK